MSKISRCLFCLLILAAFDSNAKVFRNAYISFEMPDTWKCVLEQTEWVCRSDPDQFPKEAKEAIIILTAKEVGPTDSLASYEQHLNAPITMNGRGGVATQSKVQYKAKQALINNQTWVDGFHLNSEVNNYFTRYFATIKDRVAVLVTFSAHQMYYSKYSQDFIKAIMSMQIIATKNLLARPDNGQINPSNGSLFGQNGLAMPLDTIAQEPSPENSGGQKKLFLLIAIILAAVGAYVYIKSRKK